MTWNKSKTKNGEAKKKRNNERAQKKYKEEDCQSNETLFRRVIVSATFVWCEKSVCN